MLELCLQASGFHVLGFMLELCLQALGFRALGFMLELCLQASGFDVLGFMLELCLQALKKKKKLASQQVSLLRQVIIWVGCKVLAGPTAPEAVGTEDLGAFLTDAVASIAKVS